MDNKNSEKTVTGDTLKDLNELVQKEIIENGWNADGAVNKEPDGTYSQKLIK